MMEEIFDAISLSMDTSVYSVSLVIFNIFLSFFLGLLVCWIYRKTYKGISYSKQFVLSLVMISVISTVAMMVIGNSVTRAFALLGTFSIIRFRNAMKEPHDIAYVFFSLIIGVSIGTGNYMIAAVSSVILSGILYYLSSIDFGSLNRLTHLLYFTSTKKTYENETLKDLFDNFVEKKELLNISTNPITKKLEFNYYIRKKKTRDMHEFVERLDDVADVENISLTPIDSGIEY